MITTLHRSYPFTVRNLHRETVDSYTHRLLDANFATEQHHRALTAAAHRELAAIPTENRWLTVLANKAGRPLPDLDRPRASGPQHSDGTSCEHCLAGIGTRIACTLCMHGDTVEQHPHFDNNVCRRHHTWVAPGTAAAQQHPVGQSILQADKRFRRLVRQRRIDVPLFVLLMNAATAASPMRPASQLYPQIIGLAETLTGEAFGRVFFNPDQTFAVSLEFLRSTIDTAWGIIPENLLTELWMRFRSSFVSLRESINRDIPYVIASPHDIPINRNVAHNYRAARTKTDLSDFETYIAALRATTEAALPASDEHLFAPSTSQAKNTVATICGKGHRSSRLLRSPCRVCSNRILYTGYNDLATRNPDVAREWHPTRNAMAASSVFPTSKAIVWWRCPENHDYRATPSNRTANGSTCSVCQHRVINPGENDLCTLYPQIACDWRYEKNVNYDIMTMAPGSNQVVWWICKAGHTYKQSIGSRVRGRGCKRCRSVRELRVTIADGPEHLAQQWDVDANLPLTKETVTLGSRRECKWLCPSGHRYAQRPERRMAGYACPFCSGHAYERGTNDFATMFPLLATEWHSRRNLLEASDQVARSRKIWWKCTTAGHEYEQTIYHRIQSNGCPNCPKEKRVGASEIA